MPNNRLLLLEIVEHGNWVTHIFKRTGLEYAATWTLREISRADPPGTKPAAFISHSLQCITYSLDHPHASDNCNMCDNIEKVSTSNTAQYQQQCWYIDSHSHSWWVSSGDREHPQGNEWKPSLSPTKTWKIYVMESAALHPHGTVRAYSQSLHIYRSFDEF